MVFGAGSHYMEFKISEIETKQLSGEVGSALTKTSYKSRPTLKPSQ